MLLGVSDSLCANVVADENLFTFTALQPPAYCGKHFQHRPRWSFSPREEVYRIRRRFFGTCSVTSYHQVETEVRSRPQVIVQMVVVPYGPLVPIHRKDLYTQ